MQVAKKSPNSARAAAAVPSPMQVDIDHWARQLDVSNFANAFAQYRDFAELGAVQRILVIGPGQGLDTAIFRWRGYEVVTLDIDDRLKPDVIGSAHDLSRFGDKSFDVVIASHVLEHIPPAFLDRVIDELARVAHHALIYLPLPGRIMRLRLAPGFGGHDWSFTFNLFNPFDRPDPETARFCAGQHYWELGRPGFRKREVEARFARRFSMRRAYRNPDWPVSFNYVLSAR